MNALYWVVLALIAVIGLALNGALVAVVMKGRKADPGTVRRLRSRARPQRLAAAALGGLATVLLVGGVIYTESASQVEASGPDGLQASTLRTAQNELDLPAAAPDPLQVTATGQQWIWRYEYPSGTSASGETSTQTFADVFSYYELVVPVDTAVVVSVQTTDVAHSWWIPGLTAKVAALPGQTNKTWFKADQTGVYEGASYQFSGAAFSAMRTAVRVVTADEYKAWLGQQATDISDAQQAVQNQIAGGSS